MFSTFVPSSTRYIHQASLPSNDQTLSSMMFDWTLTADVVTDVSKRNLDQATFHLWHEEWDVDECFGKKIFSSKQGCIRSPRWKIKYSTTILLCYLGIKLGNNNLCTKIGAMTGAIQKSSKRNRRVISL